MNTTLFLSVDYLKKNTILDYNIEDNLLESSILDAQNIDIQAILGTSLYKKLITLIDDGNITGTTNSDFKELIDDFILPCQIKFSLLRSLLPMRVAFRNKGLMENSSDNSQPVDFGLVTYAENKIKNDTEFYSNKLKSFLCDFFTKYPEYSCDTSQSDYTTPNRKNSYNTGIYVKK